MTCVLQAASAGAASRPASQKGPGLVRLGTTCPFRPASRGCGAPTRGSHWDPRGLRLGAGTVLRFTSSGCSLGILATAVSRARESRGWQ